MTVIREGSSTWGDVIARLDGDQVLEGDSMFGDVVVHIDGDFIRKGTGWTADVIANLDDTEIRKGRSSWGEVLCKIEGDEIVKDWSSSAMFNIDGEASDIEKAALAVAALILTGELDEADSGADTSEAEQSDLDESDSSEDSESEDDSDLDSYTTASQIDPPAHTTATARKPTALSEPTRKDHTGDGCLVFFVLAALVGGFLYFRPDIAKDAINTFNSAIQQKQEPTTALTAPNSASQLEQGSCVISVAGAVINNVNVSDKTSGISRHVLIAKVNEALGQPSRMARSKSGEESFYWEGVSLTPDPTWNILSINLESGLDEAVYRGQVSVEGISINHHTSISELAGNLKDVHPRNFSFTQTSNSPSGSSLWDLTYADFVVRFAYNDASKLRAIIVFPNQERK